MTDGIIDGEVPKRVKYSGGKLVPEFPEQCEPHTKTPGGYGAFFDFCETMSETHIQRQCLGCGLYAVWEPRLQPAEAIDDGGARTALGLEAPG
jgi:hypothetical protein